MPGTLPATLIVCVHARELRVAVLDELGGRARGLDLLGGGLAGDVDDRLAAVDVDAGALRAEGRFELLGFGRGEVGGLGGGGGGHEDRGGGDEGDELHGTQTIKPG